MQLVINSYGAYLHTEGERFVVKSEGKVAEVAADKVETILITTSAMLSTDAVALALERNVDIVFLNKFGDPMGRVWHSKLGSTTRIRRWQLQAEETPRVLLLLWGL